MDTETLFTATKWEILKHLEQKSSSPLELAEALQSSLANVSQQLKLLELAGLVTSKRITNRDKGKPRTLYSLSGNLSYMIAATDSFVDKKVVQLSEINKVVLRIWFLEDASLRYTLEKAFWSLEPHLDSVHKLTYAGMDNGIPVLEVHATTTLPGNLTGNEIMLKQASDPVGYVLYSKA